MTLLKQILQQKLNEDPNPSLVAATPQNKAENAFSLIKNIHGADLSSGDVINHLQAVDDSEDAVDTVAFGLETTDGDIVKVYVNADEAEAFEQRMAQLLGKIDDIDQAIEELSNDFDIVSVVKPGEMDAEEVGQEPEFDGENTQVGIENQLDEPLSDDDLVSDLETDDMIGTEGEKDEKKKSDKKDSKDEGDEEKDPEDSEESEEKPEGEEDPSDEDSLDMGDDVPADDEEKPEGEEDKEGEGEGEEEKSEDDEEEPEPEEEDEEKSEKDEKKEKKKSKSKDEKMKQESQSLLQYLVSLNEAKSHPKKVEAKKEEPKKVEVQPDESADVFSLSLTKEEEEISKIFSTPAQQLIFRTVLLLGVNAEQISMRKFKVRKSVKDVATMIQHHPQIKNILSKLGRDLSSKKSEIHRISEALDKNEKVEGTIKDQLATEIAKKIYNLIIALGIPEFLLTYKKTAFRDRIKNLAKIAVKHPRIKTYIYMLSDLLKAEHKSSLKEGYEAAKSEIEASEVKTAYKSNGLLEDFSKTDNAADLGTFTIVSMGDVGGTTLKVKNFSVEFGEEEFEKVVELLADGKSGVVKSENLGKVNLIALARGKEYVIKSVKPGQHDKYPFGVLISAKSIDRILG